MQDLVQFVGDKVVHVCSRTGDAQINSGNVSSRNFRTQTLCDKDRGGNRKLRLPIGCLRKRSSDS